MDVHLARNTPLVLGVEAGAAQSMLDLSPLKVTRLDLQTGATRTRLPTALDSTDIAA